MSCYEIGFVVQKSPTQEMNKGLAASPHIRVSDYGSLCVDLGQQLFEFAKRFIRNSHGTQRK